jgi:hypothetical protein
MATELELGGVMSDQDLLGLLCPVQGRAQRIVGYSH